MNIFNNFGEVYWNAACLSVNASADDEDTEKSGSTDYGRIASSISKMQKNGIKISLPEINTALFGFYPNQKKNEIVFGLKGITNIGDDIAKLIITNRPYHSLADFLERTEIPNVPMINLIKAGCFDLLENRPREEIMKAYIRYYTIKTTPPTKSLTMAHFKKLIDFGLYNEDTYPLVKEKYYFLKHVSQKQFERRNEKPNVSGHKIFVWLDDKSNDFFKKHFQERLVIGKDYFIKDGEYIVNLNRIRYLYNKDTERFKIAIKTNANISKRFNQLRFKEVANEIWNKYCLGSIGKWEMDSISFYYTEHELHNVSFIKNGLVDFFRLPSDPSFNFNKKNRNGQNYQFNLYKIVGTVLDKDKIRKTVTLLTPSGVVTLKFYSDLFIQYNRQISVSNPDGTKTVIDKSWFKRGTKLQVMGFRRDEQFIPRVYYDVVYKTVVAKIGTVYDTGDYELITERPRGESGEDDE